ncbi:hypothetical protein TPHA_0I01530 [Tetrapisispora phaffii CBS 4417]|uniref:Nudix hydrolase domain-containing protein n=1 Tax=Tetrapisispora phaffii (strain ATCC 24235 / CBS 4417 / NBRC 1672 / NRRL Y-8282 / UCD 70-5) TaxID=1071381 RepID=G8BXN1_TETPH|nr:hypothetical protein TPHA_0I01530 [Tetrapisispora phaffii CBS 4417]CCE64659.1 hypothetical protein TPHA_0I01530 [Tetrapisispora phaffii CBS 4417]
MSLPLRHSLDNLDSLDRILEDLLVRFIINVPPEDLSSVERELFHFEEASWFYIDFIKLLNPSLPSLKIKSFATNIIRICPIVWRWDIKADEALQKFSLYKKSIPVRGAAIFNEKLNKILLVQGTESDSWSFPRGKISKDEDDVQCCIREVKEEIGFDLTGYIDENQFVERNISGKNYKIYLVSNVPEATQFKPQVRNEIDKIEWKDFKKIMRSIFKQSGSTKYYLINAMIRPLSIWCKRQKEGKDNSELIRNAEKQLKELLGITSSTEITDKYAQISAKDFNAHNNSTSGSSISDSQNGQPIDIDPGRALLNSLQSAFNVNSNNINNTQQNTFMPPPMPILVNGNGNANNMFPPMMNGGFQPFAPFPIVNNNHGVLPLMNNNFHPTSDSAQFHIMNMNNINPRDIMDDATATPNTASLSKPSLVDGATHDNAKQLLTLLNDKKPEQFGTSPQVANAALVSQVDSSNSKDLLHLLKHEPQSEMQSLGIKISSGVDIPDDNTYEEFESSSEEGNDEDSYMNINHSDMGEYNRASVLRDNFNDKTDQQKLENLDGEEFSTTEMPNSAALVGNSFGSNGGDIPHVDEVNESTRGVASLSIAGKAKNVNNTPKIKLLKRGEQLSNNALSPPKVSPESIPYQKNTNFEESSGSPNELLKILKAPLDDKKSYSTQSQQSTNPLLDMLKKPSLSDSPTNRYDSNLIDNPNSSNSQIGTPVEFANQIPSMVPNNKSSSPLIQTNGSPQSQSHANEFLNVLNDPNARNNSKFGPPSGQPFNEQGIPVDMPQQILTPNGSQPPGMSHNQHQFNNLQFNQFYPSPMEQPPHLVPNQYVPSQMHAPKYMDALNNHSPQSSAHMSLSQSQSPTHRGLAPAGNELLNMLKGPNVKMGLDQTMNGSPLNNNAQSVPQMGQTASNQLLNLLHKK